jgi:hypothetical protein
VVINHEVKAQKKKTQPFALVIHIGQRYRYGNSHVTYWYGKFHIVTVFTSNIQKTQTVNPKTNSNLCLQKYLHQCVHKS